MDKTKIGTRSIDQNDTDSYHKHTGKGMYCFSYYNIPSGSTEGGQ